jgi:hypothetical protein
MVAENTNASAAPTATVEPIALSTGTFESASTPNPITVLAAAKPSDTTVRPRSSPEGAARSKNSE